MPSVRILEIGKSVSLCRLADTSFKMSDEDVLWLAKEISEDYKSLSTEEINGIIKKGIKGEYDEDKKHFAINSRVVCDWLREGNEWINPSTLRRKI